MMLFIFDLSPVWPNYRWAILAPGRLEAMEYFQKATGITREPVAYVSEPGQGILIHVNEKYHADETN